MNNNKWTFAAIATSIALIITGSILLVAPATVSAQNLPYKSCTEDALKAPLNLSAASSATQVATQAATSSASAATAATTGADDIVFLSIVGSESQACYTTAETFLKGNMMNLPAGFNGAVGITKTIKGDIALDRTNVANSQIGDITINISEFQSDNPLRDNFIRSHFLESNTYPYVTLTNASAIGLPSGAYQDGSPLKFQIKGTLTAHNKPRETTFDATGSYTGGALVVRAVTVLNMSDFGIEPPNIANLLKVEDTVQLVVNIVAREAQATPAAT